MKNLAFCFILVASIIACSYEGNDSSTSSETKLVGTIDQPTDQQVTVLIDGEETILEVTDGSFSYSFEIDQPKIVTVQYDRVYEDLFVAPGKTSKLEIQMRNPDEGDSANSIQFTGDFSIENEFFSNGLQEYELPGYRDLFAQDEQTFLQTLDTYQSDVDESIKKAQSETSFDPFFQSVLDAHVDYEVAEQLMMFESYHRYVTENEDYVLSDLMKSRIDAIQLDNPEAIESPNYRSYLSNTIQQSAWNKIKDLEDIRTQQGAMTEATIKIMDEQIESSAVKDLVFFQIMKSALYDGLQSEEQDAFDRFLNENRNESYISQIKSTRLKWEALDPGKDAPAFNYPDIQGKMVSLKDLNGKVVYVDVWATWCGPCKAEHPDLEKLEHQFQSNPSVAFVGISIDENKEAWEKMVQEKEMQGYQLISDKAWDSDIIKDYMIRGIPRFILIDAEGKVIQASAPRPSSGKVADLINAELSKSAKEALLVH